MTETARRVSQSEVKGFKTCRRQWYLSWREGYTLRPEQQPATGVAQLGTHVHLALEAYYGYNIDPLAVLRWVYAALSAQRLHDGKELESELSYALLMVEGYLQWAAENGTDEEFEVIGTERLLEVPINVIEPFADGIVESWPVILTGRIDQTIRRRDGSNRTYIRDWKTVSTLAKANELQRNEQMRWYDLLYWLLGRASGEQAMSGVYYTMLKRSKRTTRAAPPFYEAVSIHYTTADRLSMIARIEQVVGEMLLVEDELLHGSRGHKRVAYPSPGDHCRYCPFRDVCHMADDGSRFEDALAGIYVKADPYAYQSNDSMEKVRQAFPSSPAVLD